MFVVNVDEPAVKELSIEVDEQIMVKPVLAGELIVFTLEEAVQIDQLKVKALNEAGQPLYTYRYAADEHRIDHLKWYPL